MRNRTEDMEDQFACCRCRVDLLFKTDQVNALALEILDGLEQLLQGPAKAAETGDGCRLGVVSEP